MKRPLFTVSVRSFLNMTRPAMGQARANKENLGSAFKPVMAHPW